ncbi:MAG: carbohydrate binding family 9 domain-containing protein [Urechidicola sp.]|nr:carbohydrate binding family 9 domain-containing protein [Urechidicola sp.]
MKHVLTTLAFLFLIPIVSHAQESKKNVVTKRVTKAPKIDGVLDDDAWFGADIAKDFVMFRPESGTPEEHNKRTEVKIVYDDEAIYFGAYLYDDDPENIPQQFAVRDNFGTTDWFGVMINPNNDSQNDTEFFVQVTGNQADAKATPDNEDFTWSAVWVSATKIVEDGWIVEIKIPYSALRFTNKEVQTWGLNFHRRHAESRNQYSWNFIDRTVGVIQQYAGTLTGIENITPPTRLSFSPYAQASYDINDGENTFDKSIGLDVKYGISESFTLDATLIPDFGQTGFDNLVLNLGPFEQRYQEQRPFFTEGVELFTKGDLFYTRRIGNQPIDYLSQSDLDDNEVILDNPDKVNMLNAIKVSGRTEGGLGIGVFNAITERTSGKIGIAETDDNGDIIYDENGNPNILDSYKVVTEPLANYSVIVFDQQFNKNSFVSLTNTNVFREGSSRDANSTALMYFLSNKKNTHNVNGGIKTSRVREDGEVTPGYWFDSSIGKNAGKWQYAAGYEMADDKYDINDLGINFRNDYQQFYAFASYRIFEPTKTFNRYRFQYWTNLRYRQSDGAYTGNHLGLSFNATTINNFSFGGNINGQIGKQYDYYEPRIIDRYFTQNPRVNFNSYISSDYSKKFAFDVGLYYGIRANNDSEKNLNIKTELRYRFSDKFSLEYELDIFKVYDEASWCGSNL